MALSRPLAIAVAAMALLVGSVTFEMIYHRSFTVEVRDASGWLTIGESVSNVDTPTRFAAAPLANRAIVVDRNATVEFQLRVDNGYPWSYSHHYDVSNGGLRVAEGDVRASARDVGTSPFTIPAATLLNPTFGTKEVPGASTNVTFVSLYVTVGSTEVPASFQLQEAGS